MEREFWAQADLRLAFFQRADRGRESLAIRKTGAAFRLLEGASL